MYVGDFYNQAVIHNDTRGPDHNRVNAAVRPDRDHYFGRIWRVDHKGAKKIAVPDLSKAGVAELAKALEHPNRHVRMNAARLLAENTAASKNENTRAAVAGALEALARSNSAEARIAVLWTKFAALGSGASEIAAADTDASVRRNAALVAEEAQKAAAATALIRDADAHVRVAALRALAAGEVSDEQAKALVAAWTKFDDDFQRSAAVGAASRNPSAVISAALDSVDAPALAPLVSALTQNLTNADDAAKLVVALAGKPASADALKRSILEGLAKTVKDAPAMTPELSAALAKLLGSAASGSALPLAAKWDKAGTLKSATEKLIGELFAKLGAGSDGDRLAAAQGLLGLRSVNPQALPAVAKLLGDAKLSGGAKATLIAALGETGDASVGPALTAAFASLDATAQTAAFDVLLKRSEWTGALLDAVKAKTVSLANLGPANIARLRTHPDPGIAKRASDMLEELNPMAKAKNEIIAKLSPIVEGAGGDPANGKMLFTTSCAICHAFDGQGKDIGPGLTGMGSHGPGELLTAIVDPNREVDPSFVTWNFETTTGQFASGIIARENPASVIIRSLAGEQEVKVSEIKTRTNTGRSLMPEGFEALGAEAIRDIIAYMAQVDGGGYRTLDLSTAFTASSARGFYADDRGKSLDLVKTGTVKFGGVPFNVLAPEKSPTGKNVVNLRGGPGGTMAKTQMPQRVEIKAHGFKANRLHFLGGIGGWAYPFIDEKKPVLTCTVNYADGDSEKLVFRNGVEFADHIARNDVPGSQYAEGLARGHQVRWFSKQLKKAAPITSLVLESADNDIAPTLLAITAQLADANAAPLPELKSAEASEDAGFKAQFSDAVPQPPASAQGPRVLLVGGGSSHDFVKYFGETDKATLAPHVGWVDFTQNANGIAEILDRVDVLVWSANQPISAATRKALMDYVNAGKAVVAYHPGTWYAWNNFPQWNKEVVGGGARGHDKFGEFEVRVENRTHPVTAGLPESFRITDELYWFLPATDATPIEVLATATSTQKPGTYPQVFVVKHPKARIVGLTLGHDAKAHDLPEFQKLLRQAVLWAAGKTALAAK
jgi:putative heme-binding domain-containing protein